MSDWAIFQGQGAPHDGLARLPAPPPWRFGGAANPVGQRPAELDQAFERARATPFQPTSDMVTAVNAALYLRRPLLITGKPGTGKSTLISKVAYELRMGPVLRWPITSRSTVRAGLYDYDAIGRLQAGKGEDPPVENYLTLGPLGSALVAEDWPRALLIDEIDKSDLDFANDLLNVIEEGEYEIAELRRLAQAEARVRDAHGQSVVVRRGRLAGRQFPFVVMTSNGEREFPPPLLRRCIQLTIAPPDKGQLLDIVSAHLKAYLTPERQTAVEDLVAEFAEDSDEKDLSTDQLLNAVFLTVGMQAREGRTFGGEDLESLRALLFQRLSGGG